MLLHRANREKWALQRENFRNELATKAKQKIADEKASNAVIAERIRRKLLLQLEKEIDRLTDDYFAEESSEKIKDGSKTVSKLIKKKNLIDVYMALSDEDIKREKLKLEQKKLEDDDW